MLVELSDEKIELGVTTVMNILAQVFSESEDEDIDKNGHQAPKEKSCAMNKPNKCCNFGEYNCQIPMPIRGRVEYIDFCIADIVAALNAANIRTVASCCGHKKMNGDIVLEDGRRITVFEKEKNGKADS